MIEQRVCVVSASAVTPAAVQTNSGLIIWILFQTAAMTHIFSVPQFVGENTNPIYQLVDCH